jgi:hypothetical protein
MTDLDVTPLRGSVQYEYKVDRGNYTNETARVFLPIDFTSADQAAQGEALVEAFNVAKAAVADTLGLDLRMGDNGVAVIVPAPAPTVETTVRGNGNRQAAAPSAPAASGGPIKIRGDQHGDLPEWLEAQCAAAGVKTVWDNRDRLAESPRAPWFREFVPTGGTGKGQGGKPAGIWPPKES